MTETQLPTWARMAAIAWPVLPPGITPFAVLRAHPRDGMGPLIVVRTRIGTECGYNGAIRSLPRDWRNRGEWVPLQS